MSEKKLYLKLKDVLEIFPVSRSSWNRGVRLGKFPKPIKFGERIRLWEKDEFYAFLKKTKKENE